MSVHDFLREKCDIAPHLRCRSSELYVHYLHANRAGINQRAFIITAKNSLPPGVEYGLHRYFDGTTGSGFSGLAPKGQGAEGRAAPVGQFLEERTQYAPFERIDCATLYEVYLAWAGPTNACPRNAFTGAARRVLARRGVRYGVHRFKDGSMRRGFLGVRLYEDHNEAQIIPTHVAAVEAAAIMGLQPKNVHGLLASGSLGLALRPSPRKTMVAFDALDDYTGAPGRTLRLRTVCDLIVLTANRSTDGEQRRDLADLRLQLRGLRLAPVRDWPGRVIDILDALELEAVAEPGLLPAVQVMRTLV